MQKINANLRKNLNKTNSNKIISFLAHFVVKLKQSTIFQGFCMSNRIFKQKKQAGFSLTELMVSLAIFGLVAGVTSRIYYNISLKENIGNAVDVLKNQDDMTAKYLNERYDETYKALLALPQNIKAVPLNDVSVTMKDDKFVEFATKSYFPPCLIVQVDQNYKTNNASNKRLNIKLLYVQNPDGVNKQPALFSGKNLLSMTADKRNAKVINSATDDTMIQNNWSAIQSGCPYLSKVNQNSLIVDVTKNPILSSNRSERTDRTDDSSSNSPALSANSTNTKERTMSTNLYMDAVVNEAAPWSTDYCDKNKVQTDAAAQITSKCSTLATTNKRFDSIANVDNGVLSGGSCTYNVTGNFTLRDRCDSNNATGTGYSSCSAAHPNGYNFADGFAYIGGSTTPDGNGMCAANFQSRFSKITPGIPDTPAIGNCTYKSTKCDWSSSGYPSIITFNAQCGAGMSITFNADYRQNNGCYIVTRTEICQPSSWVTCQNYTPAQPGTPSTTDYQTYPCATNTQYAGTFGSSTTQACGQITQPAYNNSGVTPPQHKFKGLVFNSSSPSEVTIKSTNSDGNSNKSTAMLGLNAAGIKAGYIMMKSPAMTIGNACSVDKLGTMVQQKTEGAYTASQLVCSYNTSFCQGDGYCYAPMKSQTQFAISTTAQTQMSCPDGLRIDTTWIPSVANQGLQSSACSVLVTPATNGGMAYGWKTTCNGTPYASLLKILCTSASTSENFNNCVGDGNGGVTCDN